MKLKRFMMFLVVLIVSVTMGMLTYYFVRDDEVVSISTRPLYVNVGTIISLEDMEFVHTHKNEDTVIDFNAGGDEVTEIIEYKHNEDTGEMWYEAKKGGRTTIKITTNNEKFATFAIDVVVGDGSTEYPFMVNNELDLISIGQDNRPLSGNYQLSTDITLTREFVPIGIINVGGSTTIQQFTGKFDGNGYAINGLNIATSYDKAGLFAHLSTNAIVQRLTLTNATITGDYTYVGAIAGQNDGIITRCIVTASTITNNKSASDISTGLVTGYMNCSAGTNGNVSRGVTKTSAEGVILAKGNIGGMVGNINSGVVQACWADAEINANGGVNAGGLVGLVSASAKGNITESYAIGNITTPASYTGGLIGNYAVPSTNSEFAVYGLYFDCENYDGGALGAGSISNAYATNAMTTGEMKAGQDTYILAQNPTTAVVILWHFAENVWYTEAGMYPIICDNASSIPSINIITGSDSTGKPSNPDVGGTEIIAPETNIFDEIRLNPTGSFAISADQDLNGATIDQIDSFSGYLTSQGNAVYTIKNFTLVASGTDGGIFKLLSGTIASIRFENVTVTGSVTDNLGMLAGKISSSADIYDVTLDNVSINASAKYMGGLVGYLQNNTLGKININNLTLNNTNTVAGSATGGVVGYSIGKLGYWGITNEAYGVVVADADIKGYNNVGGVAGISEGAISYAVVENSSEDIGITARSNSASSALNAGGIVGQNGGNVMRSSCTGVVVSANREIATASNYINVGGIVGMSQASTFISGNDFVDGKVQTGGQYINAGGIVGFVTKGDVINNRTNGLVDAGYGKQVYAGGIAGLNQGVVTECANMGNVYGTYAGGVVARNESISSASSISYAVLRKLATGVVKECYASGGDPSEMDSYNEIAEKNTIKGVVVGGICAIMDYGYIVDCYARCDLATGTINNEVKKDCGISSAEKAGLIAQIDGTESKYGLMENCISLCTFDSAGMTTTINKYETVSPIFSSGKRSTGTILNCAVDTSVTGASSAQNALTNITNWLQGGATSGSSIVKLEAGDLLSPSAYSTVCSTGNWYTLDAMYPMLQCFR